MSSTEESPLEALLARHDFEFTARVTKRLKQYCRLLWEANRQVNLTRHTDFDSFVSRDLVDVMQLSALLPENHEVLDIGSGGGVPGLVLAIVRPDLQISVCDSVGKKAAILSKFIEQLDLPVTMYHDRAENVLDDMRFDTCTARAAGPMWKLLTWLNGRWLHANRLLAFKGPRWAEEVSEAKRRGLTKGLVIKPVARYPLYSTDKDAQPLESFIIQARPASGPTR